ncbi:hypothetical protein B0H14DRAFT_2810763 [Mycena olivaceomarginata]|nr:hypothetical protein B0H14DRAFT_2810763 [Mycena olivaceomarginata]
MGTPSGPAGANKLLEIPSHSPSATVSFENLVALANYQERIKDARKIPVADLHTLRNCLEHAGIGGLRTAGLAFAIRASFNVFWHSSSCARFPARWFGLFATPSLGPTVGGTFAALYKFLVNALPILIPACPSTAPLATPGLRRRAPSLSLSAHAQMVIVRKRTRRWESALAGAISGLAIFWEKRSRRVVIAQQLFVRSSGILVEAYKAVTTPTRNDRDSAFRTAPFRCGQIMYALPRSYVGWIQEASKASSDSFIFNRKAVYESMPSTSHRSIASLRDATPRLPTPALSSTYANAPLAGAVDLPHYVPCYALHPMTDTCSGVAVSRFIEVARWMLPIYSALHFVPSLLRWGQLRTDPVRFLPDSAFLGAFVRYSASNNTLYERLMAVPLSSPLRRLLPQSLIDLLISKGSWWVDRRRHAELAMYVLPKGLESLWVVARGHGLIWHTGNWGRAPWRA